MADTAPLESPVPSEGAPVGAVAKPPPPEVVPLLADESRRVGRRYVIVSQLGAGGMGAVYRAWDLDFAKYVALKFLKSADETARAYFRREAQLAAGLSHPNIAAMYEIGEHGGAPYIAMQLVDGPNLWTARRSLSRETLVRLVRDAARAVHAAHEKGIVHRDLKPQNMMVEGERVFVMDFGLAKQAAAEGVSLSGEEKLLGTPEYMPPEQARGNLKEVDAQSDVYALGATLYELLTGRPPFTSESRAEVLMQVLNDEPVRPRKLVPDLAADVETITLKCLEKEKARRYATALAVAEDLDRYLNHDAIEAHPPSALYRLGKRIAKRPLQWGFAAAMVAAIMTAGTLWVTSTLRSRRDAEERARVEREGRVAVDAERIKTAGERDRANERVAYGYLMRARQATEAGDPRSAAVLYAEAYKAFPTAVTRANANLSLGRFHPLKRMLMHPEGVSTAVLTRDRRRLVTAGFDKTVRQWDLETGAPVGAIMQHSDSVLRLAVSRDGRRICSSGADSMAHLWDGDGHAVGSPMKHDDSILCFAFSPDGTQLATGGADKCVRLWDAVTGALKSEDLRHVDRVEVVTFAPDGTRLAVGGGDEARVWTTDTLRPVGEPMKHDGTVTRTVFSPDGTRLLTVSQGGTTVAELDRAHFEARLWDTRSGAPIGALMRHKDIIECADFSPDGKWVVTGSRELTARLWNALTGAPAGVFACKDFVTEVAFSPDGRRLATGGSERAVRLWDVASGAQEGMPMHHGSMISGLAFAADGLVAWDYEGVIAVWDVTTPVDDRRRLAHDGWVRDIAASPDSRALATACADGTARVWDIRTGRPLGPALRHADWVSSVGFAPDGRRLLTAGYDAVVRQWDWASGTAAGPEVRSDDRIAAAAYTPDARRIVVIGKNRRLRIWDAATGRVLGVPIEFEDELRWFFFTPENDLLLLFHNGGLGVWSAVDGAPRGAPWSLEDAGVRAISSRSGRAVETRYRQGMQLWDLAARRPVGERMKFEPGIAAFSEDGQRLACALADGVRLFDGRSGALAGRLLPHRDNVVALGFSADGGMLATVTDAKRLQLWDVETGEPIGTAVALGGKTFEIEWSRDGSWLALRLSDKSVSVHDLSALRTAADPDELLRRAWRDTGLRLDRYTEIEVVPPVERQSLTRGASRP